MGIPHKRLDGNLASALDKIPDKTAANDDNRGTSFFLILNSASPVILRRKKLPTVVDAAVRLCHNGRQ
jgi:hypothetical protein